jgi:hypothetical protein
MTQTIVQPNYLAMDRMQKTNEIVIEIVIAEFRM